MKTLRQIREEFDVNYVPQIPEELTLEGTFPNTSSPVPSNRQMPVILIFRRMMWKVFPGKQTVALYYSKTLDKYLSIPFGPQGNLNLSESRVYNSVEELEESWIGDKVEKGRQWAHDKLKDSNTFKVAQKVGHHLPGYGDAVDAKKKWASGDKWGAVKSAAKNVTKAAATGAAVAGAGYAAVTGGAAALAAGGAAAAAAASGGGDGEKEKEKSGGSVIAKRAPSANMTVKDVWSNGPARSDRVKQSKTNAAQYKALTQKENTINDLRKMVTEDTKSKSFVINGRNVPLNSSMAKRIVEVYDSVNVMNKRKIERMINEDVESFKKLLHFSIKQ